ncbi:MAG: hypothetical protein Q8P82_02970 [bacterium]|nr:hypothetical protein [bacterium]
MISSQELLRTLAYFDLFEYPLTTFEVWKLLRSDAAASLEEVCGALDAAKNQGLLETEQGFWCIAGRKEIVGVRQARYMIAERKDRRAIWATRFLKLVPGIRMVAIVNTLALSHARDGSDIDFFIITRPGALWSSRFWGVLPFKLLGLRPRIGQERDLFCFSFFATETALDFSRFRIAEEDPYLMYWVASMIPLYDPDGLMEAVWDTNSWVQPLLPNAWPAAPGVGRHISGRAARYVLGDKKTSIFEGLARAIQMLMLPSTLTALMNVDGRVIVTDEILKLHTNDRREEIRGRYEARCRTVCPVRSST